MADCKETTEEGNRPAFVLKVDPPKEATESPPENATNDTDCKSQKANNKTEKSPAAPQVPLIKPKGTLVATPNSAFSQFGNSPIKFRNSFGSNDLSNSTTSTTSSKSRAIVLRPSQLGAITNSTTATTAPIKSVLQPAKLQNPFTKVPSDSVIEDAVAEKQKSIVTEPVKETKNEEKESKQEETKPVFLPLGVSTKESENNVNNTTVEPSASTPSFVFGQNLEERVTVANDAKPSEKPESEETKKEETSNSENGSSELLFSSAATACRTTVRQPGLTLSQAAQELEEANRANKRKYSEVTLLTGEEGEKNVLQINCKLFAFDKASSGWQERGRGTLRLNDRDEESRLVGRTAGTQRVVLNTKIWSGMTAERAGPKSLRLTAMDVNGDIRIFIVQAASKEIEQLDCLLQPRLKRAQERQPKKLATDH